MRLCGAVCAGFRARRSRAYAGSLAAMPLKLIHGPPNSGHAGLLRRRLRGRARARSGPGRAHRRRRLRLRARALRGGRGAGRVGDDLRGAVPHRRHRRRRAAGRRALPRPAPAGGRGRGRGPPRAARAAAALGLPPRLRPRLRAAARRAAGRRRSTPRRSRQAPGPSRAPPTSATSPPLQRLRRGARADRPDRLPRDRPRGDRAAAPRRLLLGRPSGLPIWTRRPHPEPVRAGGGAGRADRGDRRAALRGGERGAGGARAAARRAARADRSGRGGDDRGADPGNTDSELLFHLARGFGGARAAAPRAPDDDLLLLRSAGVRGEAEAIAAEVSRLVDGGADPAEIAIALRDPAGAAARSPRRWRPTGWPTALEAELPVAGTAVGGALVALLEAEFGTRRAADLLRYLRGPSGFSPGRVDWLERALRRGRIEDAEKALALLARRGGRAAARPDAAARGGDALARGTRGGGREAGGDDGGAAAARRRRRAGAGPRRRAGAARRGGDRRRRSPSWPSWARWRRAPAELAATIAALEFRVWSGPVEGRVRIASPYRLRAGRFDHVFVGSLQDGEFPRRDRGGDPFLSEAQRGSLGLDPRRDTEAEERYLFGVCLALPRRRLFLSYRDSDESGGAESRSPLLEEVRALLAPAPDGSAPDPVEEAITREPRPGGASSRRWPRRPRRTSWRGRWRRTGRAPTRRGCWPRSASREARGALIAARIAAARAGRGRLARARPADQPGGARVAGRGRRLRRHHAGGLRPLLLPLVRRPRARPAAARPGPRPAGPGRPDARVARPPLQGAPRRRPAPPPRLARRPGSRAGASSSPRSRPRRSSAPTRPSGRWRGGSSGCWSASSPKRRGARPAASSPGCWRPPSASTRRPSGRRLELDGWGLHGAIDRVDRAPDGRALVIDYKLVGLGHAAGEVRGAGEAAAAALPAGGRRALGRASRSAASTTRCAGPRCGARAGS